MHARFEQMDRRFEQIDRRFEQIDRRFERVEQDIVDLRSEMNRRFDELPAMVRDVMREVLAETRKATN